MHSIWIVAVTCALARVACGGMSLGAEDEGLELLPGAPLPADPTPLAPTETLPVEEPAPVAIDLEDTL